MHKLLLLVNQAAVTCEDVKCEGLLSLLNVVNHGVDVVVLQHRQQRAKDLLRHYLTVH